MRRKREFTRPAFFRGRGAIAVYVLLVMAVSATFLFSLPAKASLEGLHVGMQAPEFTIEDLDGKKYHSNDLVKDGMTTIIFWSTWSLKSEKALTRFEQIYSEYKDKGFHILPVNVEKQDIGPDDIDLIKKKATDLGLTMPMYMDQGLQMFEDYGVIAIPSTVVLDSERVILYEMSGFPLVGSEYMISYMRAKLEGREPAEERVVATGHKPSKKAVRYMNLGRKTKQKKTMAQMAESYYRKAIEADPAFVMPYVELARFQVEQGKLDEAEKSLTDALAQEPSSPVALCELGRIRLEQNGAEEAIPLQKWAIESEESYTPAYYLMAYAYSVTGNKEEAARRFEEALTVNPFHPGIYVYRGRMNEDTDSMDAAAADYRKALELLIARKR